MLPHLEEGRACSMNGPPYRDIPESAVAPGTQLRSLEQIVATPITVLYCPTRRPAQAYPTYDRAPIPPPAAGTRLGGRTDYAINGGSSEWENSLVLKWPESGSEPGRTICW